MKKNWPNGFGALETHVNTGKTARLGSGAQTQCVLGVFQQAGEHHGETFLLLILLFCSELPSRLRNKILDKGFQMRRQFSTELRHFHPGRAIPPFLM